MLCLINVKFLIEGEIMKIKNSIITAIILSSLVPLSTYAATEVDKLKSDVKDASADAATLAKDTAITAKIKALLALESDIASTAVSVTTKSGIVSLVGKADTALQANRIIELAQSVSGVSSVDDSKLLVQSSDNFLKDAFITAKVKGKIEQLANDGKISKNSDLHVETTNSAVHIFGKVTKRSDIKVIEDAAKSISNVKEVKTNIDVVK